MLYRFLRPLADVKSNQSLTGALHLLVDLNQRRLDFWDKNFHKVITVMYGTVMI